jgi:hypothetical protein
MVFSIAGNMESYRIGTMVDTDIALNSLAIGVPVYKI